MNNNTPKIRFKGFNDAWEQRKLWEYTIWDKRFNEVETAKQPKVIKYPYLLAEDFKKIEDSNGNVQLISTGQYVGYTTEKKAGDYLCDGEVVTIPWGGVPNIKYFKGKFVTTDNRIATSSNQNILNNKYLYYYMNHNINFIEGIYRGASIRHPSMNDLLNMPIIFPDIKEQNKIASILTNIDNLITLHQRKCDKLTKMKKSMLEKMFPKNSSKTPEIRFKGFTDDWEQRKLSETYIFSQGMQVELENQLFEKKENMEQFIRIVDVTQTNEPLRYIYNSTGKGHVNANDIFFVRYGAVGTVGYGYTGTIANNLFKLSTKEKYDNNFMYQQFSNGKFNKKLIEVSASTSMPAINFSALKNLEFSLTNIKEQEKIGNLFERIDNLINLNQRKLDKLNNIKKSLLDKMFV